MICKFAWPGENLEYSAYIASLTDANTEFSEKKWPDLFVVMTEDDIELPPVPDSITPVQMRIALNRLNLRDDFEENIAASSRDVRDWWEFSLVIQYESQFLDNILDGQQRGQVFRLAAQL